MWARPPSLWPLEGRALPACPSCLCLPPPLPSPQQPLAGCGGRSATAGARGKAPPRASRRLGSRLRRSLPGAGSRGPCNTFEARHMSVATGRCCREWPTAALARGAEARPQASLESPTNLRLKCTWRLHVHRIGSPEVRTSLCVTVCGTGQSSKYSLYSFGRWFTT